MNEEPLTNHQYTVPFENSVESHPDLNGLYGKPDPNVAQAAKQEVLIRFFLGVALMLGICYAGIYFKKPWLLILGLLIVVPFAGMLIFFSAITDSK
jgi:hypothetical protein